MTNLKGEDMSNFYTLMNEPKDSFYYFSELDDLFENDDYTDDIEDIEDIESVGWIDGVFE